MNGKQIISNSGENMFFEEQLFETKQQLFQATSIKQAKFLQQKIKYLSDRVKENGKGKKSKK